MRDAAGTDSSTRRLFFWALPGLLWVAVEEVLGAAVAAGFSEASLRCPNSAERKSVSGSVEPLEAGGTIWRKVDRGIPA